MFGPGGFTDIDTFSCFRVHHLCELWIFAMSSSQLIACSAVNDTLKHTPCADDAVRGHSTSSDTVCPQRTSFGEVVLIENVSFTLPSHPIDCHLSLLDHLNRILWTGRVRTMRLPFGQDEELQLGSQSQEEKDHVSHVYLEECLTS